MVFTVRSLQEVVYSGKVGIRNGMVVLTVEENGVVVTPIKGKVALVHHLEVVVNLKVLIKEVRVRNIVRKV